MAGTLNLSDLLPKTWEKTNWNKDTKYRWGLVKFRLNFQD